MMKFQEYKIPIMICFFFQKKLLDTEDDLLIIYTDFYDNNEALVFIERKTK